MANQSEKKAQQTYQWYRKTYLGIVAGLYVWFLIFRIFLGWETFTTMDWIGLIILSAANYFGLKFLFYYLEHGHPRTSYSLLEECIWVMWFVMFMSVFTGYAWLLFLTIPGYLIFAYKDVVMSFLNARNQQQQPMQQQQMPMQQQQQMQRGKY